MRAFNENQESGSDKRSKHVVILPYFAQDEILRYQKTAQWLERNCDLQDRCEFLLAASPKASPSERLYESFSRIAPTRHFKCPSQVFGYPQGPTAMFWDCMDYISENYAGNGFSLWFESDMAFTKADWLDRIESDWYANEQTPILMGCYVPEVYKFRWLRPKKKVLDPHINGGACYSLDFAKKMPESARDGVFDMVVFDHANKLGRARATEQIAFSTLNRVRRDVMSDRSCVLHGFMQEKDAFVDRCVAPVSPKELRQRYLHPIHDQMELISRQISVCLFRNGRKAVLESMLLAKRKAQ